MEISECVCVCGSKSEDLKKKKKVVVGAWWDRWRAEDKDEGRMEGERRQLPPPVISAGKGF